MEEVEIRPAQRFTRTRQKTGEEEPVIGLPVTFQSGPGDASQCHQAKGAGQGQPSENPDIGLLVTYQSGLGDTGQHHQAEGAGQGQLLAAGEEGGMQRPVSRERWRFSPPRNWTERPSRPLTRSVAAWRERDRVGHR